MLNSEFDYCSVEIMSKGIDEGFSGKFGKTFKLTPQEIGYWVHEFLKQTYPKNYRKAKLADGLYLDVDGVKRNEKAIAVIQQNRTTDY